MRSGKFLALFKLKCQQILYSIIQACLHIMSRYVGGIKRIGCCSYPDLHQGWSFCKSEIWWAWKEPFGPQKTDVITNVSSKLYIGAPAHGYGHHICFEVQKHKNGIAYSCSWMQIRQINCEECCSLKAGLRWRDEGYDLHMIDIPTLSVRPGAQSQTWKWAMLWPIKVFCFPIESKLKSHLLGCSIHFEKKKQAFWLCYLEDIRSQPINTRSNHWKWHVYIP